jgi:hypothetical protein
MNRSSRLKHKKKDVIDEYNKKIKLLKERYYITKEEFLSCTKDNTRNKD